MFKTLKDHFKQSKKLRTYVFAVSIISMMFYIVLLVFFVNDGSAMRNAENVYYTFTLVLMCVLCLIGANTVGNKDVHNKTLYKPYKVKGFLLGICAQLPVWIYFFVTYALKNVLFGGPLTEKFTQFAVTFATMQYTSFLRLFDSFILGQAAAFFIVPAVCMIGYYLAYFKIDIDDILGGIHKRNG